MRKREIRLNLETNAEMSREVSNFNSFTILLLACFAATTKKERKNFYDEWDFFEDTKSEFIEIKDKFQKNENAIINSTFLKPILEKVLYQEYDRKSATREEIRNILGFLCGYQFKFSSRTLRNFTAIYLPFVLAFILFGTIFFVLYIFFPSVASAMRNLFIFGGLFFFISNQLASVIIFRYSLTIIPKQKLRILCKDFHLWTELEKYSSAVYSDLQNTNEAEARKTDVSVTGNDEPIKTFESVLKDLAKRKTRNANQFETYCIQKGLFNIFNNLFSSVKTTYEKITSKDLAYCYIKCIRTKIPTCNKFDYNKIFFEVMKQTDHIDFDKEAFGNEVSKLKKETYEEPELPATLYNFIKDLEKIKK